MSIGQIRGILIILIFLIVIISFVGITNLAKAEITYIENDWIKTTSEKEESLISTYTNHKINNGYLELTKKQGFDNYAITKGYNINQIPIRYYKIIGGNITHQETEELIHTEYYNINSKNLKLNDNYKKDNHIVKIGFGTVSYWGVNDAIQITGTETLTNIASSVTQCYQYNSTLFCINASLYIGNSTTPGHLSINKKTIEFQKAGISEFDLITIADNSNLNLSNSTLMIDKAGGGDPDFQQNGGYFRFENGQIQWNDGSVIFYYKSSSDSDCYINNSIIRTFLPSNIQGNLEFNNCIFPNRNYCIFNVLDYMNNCTFYKIWRAIRYVPWSNFNSNISDIHLIDSTSDINLNSYDYTLNLIDITTDKTNNNIDILWEGSGNNSFYRYNTFNLNTTPQARVKIYDKDGTLVFNQLSGSDGKTTEHNLLVAYYNWTTGNNPNGYYPFRLAITKDDYITYNQTFNNSFQPINYDIKLIANDGAQGNMIVSLETSTELFFFIIWIILFWLCFSPKHDYLINVVAGIFLTLFSLVMFNTYTLFQDQNFLLLSFTISVIAMFSGFLVKKPLKKKG